MLFLTRDLKDDGIVIIAPNGEELKFFITQIKGGQVRIGFEKFENFRVWRGEVWKKMQEK